MLFRTAERPPCFPKLYPHAWKQGRTRSSPAHPFSAGADRPFDIISGARPIRIVITPFCYTQRIILCITEMDRKAVHDLFVSGFSGSIENLPSVFALRGKNISLMRETNRNICKSPEKQNLSNLTTNSTCAALGRTDGRVCPARPRRAGARRKGFLLPTFLFLKKKSTVSGSDAYGRGNGDGREPFCR